ncbi:pantoate--beta-alanine ligase [Paenibacillus sp. J2TS4]|uniref:pantoate--beta-alanine ligase n=1 Tax=Paenibacillus sp. J2TS4 TaxID=2807194 RepID=UPI001B2106CB|nr:pantoate--beta-alanine ligase [Paenibacillus sp. J2TS4]GIP32426.1 pantoate--beta-alanine ligase [Paenibacillus sp. J2TS4]
MKVITTIKEMRAAIADLRREPSGSAKGIGFVPTLGYLHEGHASLLKRAREDNGAVVLSIFVNPLQFGPNEDFERYPRDSDRDLNVARQEGVAIVFMPDVQEMYPQRMLTSVAVSGITDILCGSSRPGHFDGVATVVSKLFNIIQPDRAYFGLKDAQQVAVVQRMVQDLNMNVEIVPCPTLREEDGLAMSSRNVYLTAEERRQALVLQQSLNDAEEWLKRPGIRLGELKEKVAAQISTAPLADIDYVEIVSYPSFLPLEEWEHQALDIVGDKQILIALAVRFGQTRLIDNRILSLEGLDLKGALSHV